MSAFKQFLSSKLVGCGTHFVFDPIIRRRLQRVREKLRHESKRLSIGLIPALRPPTSANPLVPFPKTHNIKKYSVSFYLLSCIKERALMSSIRMNEVRNK